MKKVTEFNPDYVDHAALDQDAIEEFTEGQITFDELKSLIGPEGAAAIKEQRNSYDSDPFLDDPESF